MMKPPSPGFDTPVYQWHDARTYGTLVGRLRCRRNSLRGEGYVAGTTDSRQVRHWADVLAILTGLVLMALAIWPGEPQASGDAAREAGNPQLLWLAYVVAGGSAIAAVLVAQRWQRRPLARGLLVLGAVTLLIVMVVFRDFGPRALLTVVLPAIALLASASAIGPMPRDL